MLKLDIKIMVVLCVAFINVEQSYSDCVLCDSGERGGGYSGEPVKKCKTRNPNKRNNGNKTKSKNENLGSNDDNIKNNSTADRPRKRCCPYNFDGTRCRVVDDRILCGYDSNIGGPIAFQDRIRRLSKGCRLRGRRIECGYEHAPFTNPRRPPAHRVRTTQPDDFDETPVKERIKSTKKPYDIDWDNTWDLRKGNMKCVEIRGRIVCKDK